MVASATTIQNNSPEPFSMPGPFVGCLQPGELVKIELLIADIHTAFGGASRVPKNLKVVEVPAVGPYDTFIAQRLLDPTDIDLTIVAGRVPYGNADGDGLASEAGLSYDAAGNVLTAPALVVSDITATHVAYGSTAGRLKGEAGMVYTEATDTLTLLGDLVANGLRGGVETLATGNPTGKLLTLYDAQAAPLTPSFPAAASHTGKIIAVKNLHATNSVTIGGVALAQNQVYVAISDGTNWQLIYTNGT